jgi:ATP-binding protein involved in chromosome partitioning
VIVTTPQSLALADAARGISMFAKVSVPVLGYVANMASFTCPDCNKTHAIFGVGAAREFGQQHDLQLLQELPLDPALGAAADDGTPAFAANPDGQLAALFRQLAAKVGATLAGRDIDRGAAFNVVAKGSDQP